MKQKAFTLIELLVVIVIIGILATISIATFKDYKAKAALARGKTFENQLTKHLLGKLIPEQKKLVVDLGLNEGGGNGTTYDSSGNNISFAVADASWNTDTPDGSAFSIDGTPKVSGFSTSTFDQTQISTPNQMTASGYIKPIDLSLTANRGAVILAGFNGWNLGVFSDDGYPYFALHYSDPIFGNKKVIENEWNHVAGSYDGTTVRVYLNGEPVAEEDKTFSFPSSDYLMSLGDSTGYSQNKYLIDRIKAFPIAPDSDFFQ